MGVGPRSWWMVGAISTGAFMTNLDATALTVALPTMAVELSAGLGSLQWVLSAYLIAATATLPSFARLSDAVGRKPILASGLLVFVAASILAALAPSFPALLAARVAQGIGASMFMSTILATAVTIFPASQRGRALGLISSVVAAGTVLGPGIGGLLTQSLGWRAVFLLNVPIGLVGATVIILGLPRDRGTGAPLRTFDFFGAMTFAAAAAGLITLLGHTTPDRLGATTFIVTFGVAVLIGIFVWWELRHAFPLVDLRLFAHRVFGLGSVAGFMCYILTIFPALLFPIYLQDALGWSPSVTGAVMTIQAGAMLLVAPLAGAWTDRRGSKLPAVFAMAVTSAAMAGAASLGRYPPVPFIVAILIVMGVAFGAFITPNNVAVLGDVPRNMLAAANGVIATLRNAGRAVGVAVAGTLYQVFAGPPHAGVLTQQVLRGVQGAFWGGAVLACLGLVVVLVMYRRSGSDTRVTVPDVSAETR